MNGCDEDGLIDRLSSPKAESLDTNTALFAPLDKDVNEKREILPVLKQFKMCIKSINLGTPLGHDNGLTE